MKSFIKQLPKAFIISLIVFAIMLLIKLLNNGKVVFDKHLVYYFLYSMLYGLTLYYVNFLLYQFLDRIFVGDKFSKKRIVIGFLGSFVITLIWIFILRIFEDVLIENIAFEVFLQNEIPQNYIGTIIITFIVVLGIYSFNFYKALQENRVKEQKIIAGTANAKFESLKSQIDPHFLFNNLNVLASLIEENPQKAQKFTTDLSKIYRYVLEQKDKELIALVDEITFAKTYINLLQMRFENSLFYEIVYDDLHPDSKIVPLSLQIILENTIKHNTVTEQRPLKITITIVNNYLSVQNNFQKKEVFQDRVGVGLQNIINRYDIITNKKVIVENNPDYFTVKIPILTKQIITMETEKFNESDIYYSAKKRVEELKGFYGNLISYCVVIPILIAVNLIYMPQFHWFWFSACGWGFGLTMHALKVFGYGSKWEERKIQEILNKKNEKSQWN